MLPQMEWITVWITDPNAWLALLALTALEIVLGIDNIVFISILTGRLPPEQQARARRLGLLAAMGMRVLLLFFLSWIMQLKATLFTAWGHEISGRDLILIVGGLFLLAKSTLEIHHKLEGDDANGGVPDVATFGSVIFQILLLDIVFSLDSVITAVGMVDHIAVMIIAVVVSVVCMMLFVDPVCRFIDAHPTFKVLALSFLLLIGVALIGEGLELHIPKGYLYFAMGFSLLVEVLNLRIRKRSAPVRLHGPRPPGSSDTKPLSH